MARWCGCLKPASPLLVSACVGLKPPSPLRVRIGCFGAFFGCIGVVGFNGCCSGASIGDGGFTPDCISGCRGVVGFTVTTSLRPVREKVRPAWSGGGCEREKGSPCVLKMAQNRRFMACWANFFAGQVEKACCWANFVAPASPPLPPSLAVGPPHPAGPTATPCGASGTHHIGHGGGFCTTRSLLAACRRRVGPPCSAIPPRWVAVRLRFRVV